MCCGASADNSMDLIDEQHCAGLFFKGLENRLEAFFKLATELRARQDRAHIKRVDLDVF